MPAADRPRSGAQASYRRGRGPYFARVPWELQDTPGIDAAAIAVYAALQRYADFGGERGAEISDSRAAKKAGCSIRTFGDRRKWLADQGWIDWESGKLRGTRNTYIVHQSLVMDDDLGSAGDADVAGAQGRHQAPTPIGTRSAPAADGGRQVAQTPSINREPDTKSHKQRARRARPDTWLTPYGDVYRDVVKGTVPWGKLSKPMQDAAAIVRESDPALDDAGVTARVVRNLRNYLEHKLATGPADFISLAKFAETFSQWDAKPAPTPDRRSAARPLTITGGRDLRDGMDAFRGAKHA